MTGCDHAQIVAHETYHRRDGRLRDKMVTSRAQASSCLELLRVLVLAILSGMYSFLGDSPAQRAPKRGSAAQRVLSVRTN